MKSNQHLLTSSLLITLCFIAFHHTTSILMFASVLKHSTSRTTTTVTTKTTPLYRTYCRARGMMMMADITVEHGRGQWKTYGNLDTYKPGKYHIMTFNKISPVGLKQFPSDRFDIVASSAAEEEGAGATTIKTNAHAILLRSHKLLEEEVPLTVRAIAR